MNTRTLVVWCADWPVIAAGFSSDDYVGVFSANRVVACSGAARGFGVKVGQRRRSAQSMCPDLRVVQSDQNRDAHAFDEVVEVVEEFCPSIQIVEPGTCAFSTRGPSRYFGGDSALVGKLTQALRPVVASYQLGIADGLFAAQLAARMSTIVDAGESAGFLASHSIDVFGQIDLVPLLRRLGIKTLGAFAALDEESVSARFGPEGAVVHRLSRGLDAAEIVAAPPDIDLSDDLLIDPPAQSVDIAAFNARRLTGEFVDRLRSHGLVASVVAVEVHSDHGESITRQWRFDGGFDDVTLTTRVRWQIDGWLSGINSQQPTAGVSLLRLTAVEVGSINGSQTELWKVFSEADRRAAKGVARVQAVLGSDSVFTAHVVEGRDPRQRIRLYAWDEEVPVVDNKAPWPARIPSPSPTVLFGQPQSISLVDAEGRDVGVSRRGTLSDIPRYLTVGSNAFQVTAVGGPWTNNERWWRPEVRQRRAFLQVLTDDGRGYLVVRERNEWWLEAAYE